MANHIMINLHNIVRIVLHLTSRNDIWDIGGLSTCCSQFHFQRRSKALWIDHINSNQDLQETSKARFRSSERISTIQICLTLTRREVLKAYIIMLQWSKNGQHVLEYPSVLCYALYNILSSVDICCISLIHYVSLCCCESILEMLRLSLGCFSSQLGWRQSLRWTGTERWWRWRGRPTWTRTVRLRKKKQRKKDVETTWRIISISKQPCHGQNLSFRMSFSARGECLLSFRSKSVGKPLPVNSLQRYLLTLDSIILSHGFHFLWISQTSPAVFAFSAPTCTQKHSCHHRSKCGCSTAAHGMDGSNLQIILLYHIYLHIHPEFHLDHHHHHHHPDPNPSQYHHHHLHHHHDVKRFSMFLTRYRLQEALRCFEPKGFAHERSTRRQTKEPPRLLLFVVILSKGTHISCLCGRPFLTSLPIHRAWHSAICSGSSCHWSETNRTDQQSYDLSSEPPVPAEACFSRQPDSWKGCVKKKRLQSLFHWQRAHFSLIRQYIVKVCQSHLKSKVHVCCIVLSLACRCILNKLLPCCCHPNLNVHSHIPF